MFNIQLSTLNVQMKRKIVINSSPGPNEQETTNHKL
jgi:hypothetical protein